MIVCFALATNNCYNTKSLLGPVQIKSPFTPDMNVSFFAIGCESYITKRHKNQGCNAPTWYWSYGGLTK